MCWVWSGVYAWLGLVVRAVVLGGVCRHLIPADCLRASPVAPFIRRWKERPPVSLTVMHGYHVCRSVQQLYDSPTNLVTLSHSLLHMIDFYACSMRVCLVWEDVCLCLAVPRAQQLCAAGWCWLILGLVPCWQAPCALSPLCYEPEEKSDVKRCPAVPLAGGADVAVYPLLHLSASFPTLWRCDTCGGLGPVSLGLLQRM
jgi:hypothetical protein